LFVNKAKEGGHVRMINNFFMDLMLFTNTVVQNSCKIKDIKASCFQPTCGTVALEFL
jgi:hypothetical protein